MLLHVEYVMPKMEGAILWNDTQTLKSPAPEALCNIYTLEKQSKCTNIAGSWQNHFLCMQRYLDSKPLQIYMDDESMHDT